MPRDRCDNRLEWLMLERPVDDDARPGLHNETRERELEAPRGIDRQDAGSPDFPRIERRVRDGTLHRDERENAGIASRRLGFECHRVEEVRE